MHPLAVVLSLAAGAMLAGIVGALLAVPLVASLNSAINYLVDRNNDNLDDDADRVETRVEEDERGRTPSRATPRCRRPAIVAGWVRSGTMSGSRLSSGPSHRSRPPLVRP